MQHTIQTQKKDQMINITDIVRYKVKESGVKNGIAVIFVPHTTAGVTINENADPDVIHDFLLGLDKISPDRNEYLHFEGNSPAHIKASLMGTSCTIMVENGDLLLGTWQGIYFCEFDGPRSRRINIKIIEC